MYYFIMKNYQTSSPHAHYCLLQYIKASLGNGNVQVIPGNQKGRTNILNNGLPQSSVLAPTIFNVFTYDLPSTNSKMFTHVNDICIVAQDKGLDTVKNIPTSDLLLLEQFFKKLRLRSNPSVLLLSSGILGHRVLCSGMGRKCPH